MYRYDEFDQAFVDARVAQFRDQVARRLSGELTEDQFSPHRLMNGLYLQLHAYMLRIAIPYGTLNARQLRKLADIARNYDRGYGHFTTRRTSSSTGRLKDTPDILAELASVEMHAIQTSGNCIRNVTADHFAGAAPTRSPTRAPRPRSCASGRRCIRSSPSCRASSRSRSTARRTTARRSRRTTSACRSSATTGGELGFAVYVGGGLGRTPFIGRKIRDFLPERDLLAYLEAILRVYNRDGRRDNKYKARIKILVHEKSLETLSGRGRGGVRGARPDPARPAAGRARAHRGLLRPARARSEAAGQRPGRAAQGQGPALRALLRANVTPTSRPATPSSPCR